MSLPWRKRPKGEGSDPPKRQKDTNGLFVLGESESSEHPLVDIVAIHGLNGDPYNTWTDDNGHLWLRDFLPYQIPNIRVLSFGYNATVAFSKSTAGIEEYSLDLLNRLQDEREDEQERSRPIIFICHSLGGIVMKKALIIANERTSTYGNILEKTKCVLFFGTPHRGSDIAYWTGLAARILHATQLSTATNPRLLSLLERNSKELADVSKQFVHRSAGLHIFTFYETEMLEYMNQLIVDKQSAVLDLPNERQYPVTANHMAMTKFANKDSQTYSIVWKCINRMVKHLTGNSNPQSNRLENENDYQKCLAALFLTEPEDDYTSVRQSKGSRLEGTCEWIQHVNTYTEWLKASGWQILLMIGDPGIGKTMTATYVVDDLRKRCEQCDDAIFAYYFCENKDEKRRTVQAILRSLLLQILRKRPSLFSCIATDFKTQGSQLFTSSNSLYALWRIALDMFKSCNSGTIIFLIDAYDECEEESQKIFLDLLQDSVVNTTDVCKIKFLITSRRTKEITRARFDEIPFVKLLKIDNGRVNADLGKFIDVKVESLAKYRYSHNRRCSIARILKDKACGTFLWVSLVIVELSKTLPSLAEETLNRMPEGLVKLYDRILKQLQHEHLEIVKNILLWIVNALRPLTVTELAIATRYSRGSRATNVRDLAHTEPMGYKLSGEERSAVEADEPDEIEFRAELDSCPFINFDNGTVHLIHQSVKDYLLNEGISTHLLPCETSANFIIFKSCTKYLSSEALVDEGKFPGAWNSILLKTHEFLRYCCQYWGEHAQRSGSLAVHDTEWTTGVFLAHVSKSNAFFNILLIINGEVDWPTSPVISSTLNILAYLGLSQLVDVLLSAAELQRLLHAVGTGRKIPLHLAASKGHVDMVRLLISKGSGINIPDKNGSTPLLVSCFNGHYEVSELLLKSGANAHMKSRSSYHSPLTAAAEKANIPLIQLIMQYGAGCIFSPDQPYKSRLLSAAIDSGYKSVVVFALESGADIRAEHVRRCDKLSIFEILEERLDEANMLTCAFHEALIQKAIALGSPNLTQLLELVSIHGCQDFRDHLRQALIFSAAILDTCRMDALLKAWKQTVNSAPDLEGLLLEATSARTGRSQYAEVVNLLLSHGVDLNHRYDGDFTILDAAVRGADLPRLQILLNAGKGMQEFGSGEAESWLVASLSIDDSEWIEFLDYMFRNHYDSTDYLERALVLSLEEDDLRSTQRLLCALACSCKRQASLGPFAESVEAPSVLPEKDGSPRTIVKLDTRLDLSCFEVHVEQYMFFRMFRVAAGLSERESYSPRPPIVPCDAAKVRGAMLKDTAVRLLYDSVKASRSHLSNCNEIVTALIHRGNLEIAKALLESGWAERPAPEVCGVAVYFAASCNAFRHAEYFLDLGGNADCRINGTTALHELCQTFRPNPLLVGLLIGKGADVNAIGVGRRRHSTTALYELCQTHDPQPLLLELLIGKGADVNAVGGVWGCPLGAAAANECFDAVESLLKAGADVDGPQGSDCEFKSPLWHAFERGNHDVMVLLLQAGANVNAISEGTPLLLSTYSETRSFTVVRVLLDWGSDCRQFDSNGRTLLHYVVEDGRYDIASRLLEAGADPDARDHSGTSPRSLAVEFRHAHIQKLFSAHEVRI